MGLYDIVRLGSFRDVAPSVLACARCAAGGNGKGGEWVPRSQPHVPPPMRLGSGLRDDPASTGSFRAAPSTGAAASTDR
jgi:hypothetical protein